MTLDLRDIRKKLPFTGSNPKPTWISSWLYDINNQKLHAWEIKIFLSRKKIFLSRAKSFLKFKIKAGKMSPLLNTLKQITLLISNVSRLLKIISSIECTKLSSIRAELKHWKRIPGCYTGSNNNKKETYWQEQLNIEHLH